MKPSTPAWIAVALALVAANAAFLVWRRGNRRISAEPRVGGFLPAPRDEKVAVPREPGPEDLPPAAPEPVVVTAADPSGAPIPGARVRIVGDRRGAPADAPEEILAEGRTDDHGAVTLVPARRARSAVFVEAEGRLPERRALAPGEGAAAVALVREGFVEGRVVEEETGDPVAGARVEAFPGSGSSTIADGEGRFVLRGLRGTDRVLRSRSDRHPWSSVSCVPLVDGKSSLELHLKPGVSLRGRVTVPGSDRTVGPGTIELRSEGRSAPVAPDGTFVLGGLRAAVRGPFRVSLGDRAFTVGGSRPEFDPATGLQIGEMTVPLPANNPEVLAFRGRITDVAGNPVAGARVVVGRNVLSRLDPPGFPGAGPAETRTAADGTWRMPDDVQGNEVLVLHPDHGPRFVIAPYRTRDRRFELPLPAPVTVRARVRDVAGRFASGAEVRAFLRSPVRGGAHIEFGDVLEGMRADPVTDAAGRAEVTGLGPGSWYLVARSADRAQGARAVLDFPETGPAIVAVDLDLAPLPVPAGRTLDSGGYPLPRVDVHGGPSPFEDRPASVLSGIDGRFRLPPVLPTPWEEIGDAVEVSFPKWTPAPAPPAGFLPPPVTLPLREERDFRLVPR